MSLLPSAGCIPFRSGPSPPSLSPYDTFFCSYRMLLWYPTLLAPPSGQAPNLALLPCDTWLHSLPCMNSLPCVALIPVAGCIPFRSGTSPTLLPCVMLRDLCYHVSLHYSALAALPPSQALAFYGPLHYLQYPAIPRYLALGALPAS